MSNVHVPPNNRTDHVASDSQGGGIFTLFFLLLVVLGLGAFAWHLTQQEIDKAYITGLEKGKQSTKQGENVYQDGFDKGVLKGANATMQAVNTFQQLPKALNKELGKEAYYEQLVNQLSALPEQADTTQRRVFTGILEDIHFKILLTISSLYKFTPRIHSQMLAGYDAAQSKITLDHWTIFKHLNDATLLNKGKYVVSYNSYQTINNFNKILNENICMVIGLAMPFAQQKSEQMVKQYAQDLLKLGRKKDSTTKNRKIIKGNPQDGKLSEAATNDIMALIMSNLCEEVFSKLLQKFEYQLQEKAVVKDLSNLQILDKKRKLLAQLATVEDKFEARKTEKFVRNVGPKVLKDWIPSSNAEVGMKFNSIIKVGVDLHEFFDIQVDENQKTVHITLPYPTILSNETNYEITKMEDGWIFNEIDAQRLNTLIRDGKNEVTQIALESDIFEKAKENAQTVLYTILHPFVNIPNHIYELQISFQTKNKDQLEQQALKFQETLELKEERDTVDKRVGVVRPD